MASEFLALFADASFCPKTFAAGWGAWAIRDDWQKSDVFGASIPIPVRSTNDAETFALEAALETLDKRGDTKDIAKFSFQSDNVHALGVILTLCRSARVSSKKISQAHIPRINNMTALQREAARKIQFIVGSRPIFLKHVKGHNAHGSGRSWVNSRCDAVAGRYMREARENRSRAD